MSVTSLFCFFSFTSLKFRQSFKFSTTIKDSYRLRSRKSSRLRSIKVLDYDRAKFSTTIDNNSRPCSSSRLRSRNSSRLRSRIISITIDKSQLRSRKKKKKISLTLDTSSQVLTNLLTITYLLIIYLTILCNHINRSPPLHATFLYLLQEMAGKDPSTRTPTRPKLPAPRRPSPSNAPSGSTSEPVDAPRPGEYPRLTPPPGYWHILHSSWNLYQPQNCHSYLGI